MHLPQYVCVCIYIYIYTLYVYIYIYLYTIDRNEIDRTLKLSTPAFTLITPCYDWCPYTRMCRCPVAAMMQVRAWGSVVVLVPVVFLGFGLGV